MSKRRRILITLTVTLLAAYFTGPQAKVETFAAKELPVECRRMNLTVPAESRIKNPAENAVTAVQVWLSFPRIQLFYMDSAGNIEGFSTRFVIGDHRVEPLCL